MRLAILLGIITVGCGPEARAPFHSPDASIPDIALPDVAIPVTCDAITPFTTPVEVAGLATGGDERTPSLSPDELTTYFTGAFGGITSQDLYQARRPSKTAAFEAPVSIAAANTTGFEFAPTISADGLTLIFTSSRIAGEGYHLYVSTRTSTLADLGAPALLGGVGSSTVTDNDTQPFLSADGQELWFASDRSGVYAIMRAVRTASGFSAPELVPEVSFAEGSQFPVASADRLTLYFATERAGAGTQGGFDIWAARRATVDDAFAPPVPITEINSAGDETPGWLSPDHCRLYLETDRSGTMDILVAARTGVE